MSAPRFVPAGKADVVRAYASPPRRSGAWRATRPGEVIGGDRPTGAGLGSPGPDQGYALHLARGFAGTLVLDEGEGEDDALAGCVAVALRRASMFGRAPVVYDLRLALTLFGFLGVAPAGLVEFRRPLFEGVANPHHYLEGRRLVALVPASTLRLSPADVAGRAADWRDLLGLVAEPDPGLVAEPDPGPTVEPDVEGEPEREPDLGPPAEPDLGLVAEPDLGPPAEPDPGPPAEPDGEREPERDPSAPTEVGPVAAVADLVAEAHDATPGAEAEPGPGTTHDPLVRRRAMEVAAKAHRTPRPDRGEVEAAVEAATVKKVRKVRKVKKVKRVARAANAGTSEGLSADEVGAGTDGSLFSRPSALGDAKKRRAGEARRRMRPADDP